IFHRYPKRNVSYFPSIRIATERRTANVSALFLSEGSKLLCLFVHRRGANAQVGLLQCLLLFLARDGDVELHLVAFGLCIFSHASPALRDAFGLRLEIFHASETFRASDYSLAFFRRDQHA